MEKQYEAVTIVVMLAFALAFGYLIGVSYGVRDYYGVVVKATFEACYDVLNKPQLVNYTWAIPKS